MHDAHPNKGQTAFWIACVLVKKGKPELLSHLIDHWDTLDPKPDVNAVPVHDAHPNKGQGAFWFACNLATNGQSELLRHLIKNWFALNPRVNWAALTKSSCPAGVFEQLKALDRLDAILKLTEPSEGEKSELGGLMKAVSVFIRGESQYRMPILIALAECLKQLEQIDLMLDLLAYTPMQDYHLVPELIYELAEAYFLKEDKYGHNSKLALRYAVAGYLSIGEHDDKHSALKNVFAEKIMRIRLKLAGYDYVIVAEIYQNEFKVLLDVQNTGVCALSRLEDKVQFFMAECLDVTALAKLKASSQEKAMVFSGVGAGAGSGAGVGSSFDVV